MTTAMTSAIRAGRMLLRAFAGDVARSSLRQNTRPCVRLPDVQNCSRAQRGRLWSAVNSGLVAATTMANLLSSTPTWSQQQIIVVPPQVIMWIPRGHGSNWFEGRPPLEPGEYGTAEDAAAAYCSSANSPACPYRVDGLTPVPNDVDWPWVKWSCVSDKPNCFPYQFAVMATGKCLNRRLGGNLPADGYWIDVTGPNATTFRVSPIQCAYAGVNPLKILGKPSCEMTGGSNPIYLGSGNKYQSELDYAGIGNQPLEFERHYNSSGATLAGPMRSQWSHTYARSVVTAGWAPPSVYVARPDGRMLLFVRNGVDWVGDPDVADRLLEVNGTNGARSGWKYITVDDDTEYYDERGRLFAIQNRAGSILSLSYDPAGRLSRVADSLGRALQLSYDSAGRLTTLTNPAGDATTYAFDSSGNLTTVTYPDGAARRYLYENVSLPTALTGIIDENGDRFATWTYDSLGRAVSSQHAGGANRVTIDFTNPLTPSVTDAIGTARNYGLSTIHGVHRLSALTQPCAACGMAASRITYDTNGNVASRIDFNGNQTTYAYDLIRNLETQRIEGLSASGGATATTRSITTEWHQSFRLPIRIAEPKRVTTYQYDAQGNVEIKAIQGTTDADGSLAFNATTSGSARVWRYSNAYSSVTPGLLVRQTIDGPRSDVADLATYEWNESGNLISVTNALGQTTTLGSYDAHGRPQQIADANDLVTVLAYDSRGRLLSRIVGTEATRYEYDKAGQLARIFYPDQSFVSYTYDAAHRLTQTQDNLGNRIVYELDASGNRLREKVVDPSGALVRQRSREYDALNRLSRDIGGANPSKHVTQYTYDDQGNIIRLTDPLGHTTTNLYDELNRLKLVVDPAATGGGVGGNTQFSYDGLDQITQVVDPRGLATGYSIDGLGNLSRLSSPDTAITSSAFDDAGNLISQIDTRGVSRLFTYDALNRLTRATYTAPAASSIAPVQLSYSYDQGTFGVGRLTEFIDPSGSSSYSYDAHGRLLQEARTIQAVSYVTGYGYDAAGRLTHIMYPTGRTVDYALDLQGRVTQIDTSARGITQPVVTNVGYQPFGPVKSFTYGNALSATRSFDLDGRIASYALGANGRNIHYDEASRIIAFEHPDAALDQFFGYDNLNRLTNWSKASANQSFVYDGVGNRTSQTIGAESAPYVYSTVSNQLVAIGGKVGASFRYDSAGNLVASEQKSFAYDARHRLIHASFGNQSAAYQLNALGQRVGKTLSTGQTTIYHYDANGHLIGETDASGRVEAEYIYLGDIPVGVIR